MSKKLEREKELRAYIEEHTISLDASHRGGTLKVDVSSLFPRIDEPVMGAYQNYLGGGLRGAVVGAAMFDPSELTKKEEKVFFELKEAIKRYFHAITNSDEMDMNDEWNTMEYEKNQNMPVSGY